MEGTLPSKSEIKVTVTYKKGEHGTWVEIESEPLGWDRDRLLLIEAAESFADLARAMREVQHYGVSLTSEGLWTQLHLPGTQSQ